jgi:hypothetical protein
LQNCSISAEQVAFDSAAGAGVTHANNRAAITAIVPFDIMGILPSPGLRESASTYSVAQERRKIRPSPVGGLRGGAVAGARFRWRRYHCTTAV